MSDTNNLPEKPMPLRVIFILNALMMILPFIFYFVITSKEIDLGGLDTNYMLYTGAAYIVSFMALVYFIKSRNFLACKVVFVLNILIAIPASAFIGVGVAIISLAISFFSDKVKAYFAA